MKTVLLLEFLILGVLFIGLSIPLIQRRVKPNPWYGFRVKRTLEDPEVWYPANEYAGRRGVWLGAVIIMAAAICYFIPGVSLGAYGAILATVLVAGCVVLLIHSFAYVRRLPPSRH